jgi:hypothetical protein
MKRFGGFDFLSDFNLNSINLLNETVINQLRNLITRINQSTLIIDAAKIVSLFQIYPPQVSVLSFLLSFFRK